MSGAPSPGLTLLRGPDVYAPEHAENMLAFIDTAQERAQ